MCSNNLTPAAAAAPIPLDNCAPKNIRFYFSPVKAATFYHPAHHTATTTTTDPTNYQQQQQQQRGKRDMDFMDSERNWMTDTTGAGGVNLKHLNNNLNNLAICCTNNSSSWKRVGLINVKKAAGYVNKINYND